MAKILNGPLAASISGGLGPVVFHQTRFGQVVQSKAKNHPYTTPAAVATKNAFRAGATSYSLLGGGFVHNIDTAFDKVGLYGRAQWNKLVSRAILSGLPESGPTAGRITRRRVVSVTPTGGGLYDVATEREFDGSGTVDFRYGFELDPSTLRALRRIPFFPGPGANHYHNLTPIAPPWFFIIGASSILPVDPFSAPYRASLGGCLYTP